MMQQNSKKLALGYLTQVQALLPKVGIDDHPGDGGPDSGKLTRLDMVRLHHVTLCVATLCAPALAQQTKTPSVAVKPVPLERASLLLQKRDALAAYLKEAMKILPTVGIELEMGDGGEAASERKLLYDNLLPLHVKLALAQKNTGDAAGAQATLLHARTLCTGKKGTYQSLVTLLVNEGLRAGFYSESVAFSRKHDIDGFRAPLVAEYEIGVRKDKKAAEATLLSGIEKGADLETKGKAKEKGSDDRWTRVVTLFGALAAAVRHDLPAPAAAARAALAPFAPDFSGIDLCRAVFLGLPDLSSSDAEAKLRAESADNPASLALGLMYLKKDTDARAVLKKIGKNGALPPSLIFHLKPAEFAALASDRAARRTLAYLRQEGRESPEVTRVLEGKLFEPPTLDPKKQAAQSRALFLDSLKEYQKRPATKGSFEYTSRQSYYAYSLAEIVPLDAAFAKAQLARIVEPRYRLVVLAALAAHHAK